MRAYIPNYIFDTRVGFFHMGNTETSLFEKRSVEAGLPHFTG